jgi:hypothetical protein
VYYPRSPDGEPAGRVVFDGVAGVRSFFSIIIAVLLSFLVAFALAEVAVRLISPQSVGPKQFAFTPELGAIPVPHQHGVENSPGVYRFTYHNNSLGWRGRREYREAKQTDYRVLFLGDSFTYGVGVNDDQTFAALVEKALRADLMSVEVINAGCPGKGTDYELKLFQTLGRKFHSDLTVLGFYPNDFQDNSRGEYYQVDKRGELRVKPLAQNQGAIITLLDRLPLYNWLISWSHAANLIKQGGIKMLVSRARRTDPDATRGLVVTYKRGTRGYANPNDLELTRIYLRQLNAAVKSAGGALMIVYFPTYPEVTGYRKTQTISWDELSLQRLAAENGLAVWSMTPLLAHSGQPIDRLYYTDGHWTAAGHDLAARYLTRIIQRELATRRQVKQSEPFH